MARLFVFVRVDVGLASHIDVTAAELRVHHRHVGNVLEHQPLDEGSLAVVAGVGDEFDMIACHPLNPLERTRPDGFPIEGGLVGVRLSAQDMLGNDEGFRQEGHIRREGLLHPPRDLGR